MNSRFVVYSLLLGLSVTLFACGPDMSETEGLAESEEQVELLATLTQIVTPTPSLITSDQDFTGQQDSDTGESMSEEEDQGDTSGDQPPENSDLTFASTDICEQVPKELVPCGRYDITFISDSMVCGEFPVPRQPESDRDVLEFRPGMDGEEEFVDTPVQSVAADGTLVLMIRQGESEGGKSYKGNGVYPASGIEPERRIEWEFTYDTTAATIEGTLLAIFETPELGQCKVTKGFEGSPG